MQSLLKLIQPLLQKYALTLVVGWVEALIAKLQTYFWKKKVDAAIEAVEKAGTNPELTPEEKAKEQKDAFDKLTGVLNNPK